MDISGVNAEELTEMILVHKRVNHRKNFECTQLGRLPPEILLKILGYVVPDCEKCFLQRDLMRLGSVCKKLNRLTKTADLYKEIRLTDECCPLPTVEAFAAMMENSGSKMKRLRCNYKCRNLLSFALKRCGDVIEEIHVENTEEWTSMEVPASMLEDISKLNPKALTLIKFNHITFTLAKKTSNEPFFSRIHDLNINWIDDAPKVYESDMSKDARTVYCARAGYCAGFPVLALRHIQSLRQVSVNLHTNDPSGTELLCKESVEPYASLSHYKLSFYNIEGAKQLPEGHQFLEITVERSTEHPQFETEPEVAFKTFLFLFSVDSLI